MYLFDVALAVNSLEIVSMGKVILVQRVQWNFSKLLSGSSCCRLVSFPIFLTICIMLIYHVRDANFYICLVDLKPLVLFSLFLNI